MVDFGLHKMYFTPPVAKPIPQFINIIKYITMWHILANNFLLFFFFEPFEGQRSLQWTAYDVIGLQGAWKGFNQMQEKVFSRTSGFDHKNNDIKNTQCKTKIKVIWSFCIGDHNTVTGCHWRACLWSFSIVCEHKACRRQSGVVVLCTQSVFSWLALE